jgi:hypothetical protein
VSPFAGNEHPPLWIHQALGQIVRLVKGVLKAGKKWTQPRLRIETAIHEAEVGRTLTPMLPGSPATHWLLCDAWYLAPPRTS